MNKYEMTVTLHEYDEDMNATLVERFSPKDVTVYAKHLEHAYELLKEEFGSLDENQYYGMKNLRFYLNVPYAEL